MATATKQAAYRDALERTFPPGLIWNYRQGSNIDKLISAEAEEFAQVECRGEDLLHEVDPRTTSEMLTDFERLLALPDPCTGQLGNVQARKAAVVEKYTRLGGASIAFFVTLARTRGFTIFIAEYKPALCGQAVCGDRMTSGAWQFTFAVHAPLTSQIFAKCGQAACGDPISTWGNTVLECLIRDAKPAHTGVLFLYDAVTVGAGFVDGNGVSLCWIENGLGGVTVVDENGNPLALGPDAFGGAPFVDSFGGTLSIPIGPC